MNGRNEKILKKCEEVTTAILKFRATVPLKVLSVVEHMDKKLEDFPDTFIKALQDMNLKPSDLRLLTPKNNPLDEIKKMLGSRTGGMVSIEPNINLIASHYVPGTFSWLEDHTEYHKWFQGQTTPFLCVSGVQGTGKSYFAYHCHQMIQETTRHRRLTADVIKTRQAVSVACWFFDSGRPETQSLQSAVSSLIVQIATQDTKFRDAIAKDISKTGRADKSRKPEAAELWRAFLYTKLERTTETSRLVYILLDGVDSLDEIDSQTLLGLLRDLNCDKTGIQVMMTGHPDKLKEMKLQLSCNIDLPEETMKHRDLEKIIDYRINKSENLSGFTLENLETIRKSLGLKSKGMF